MQRLAAPEVRQRIRQDIAAQGLNNFGRIPSWGLSVLPFRQPTGVCWTYH